MTWLSVLIFSLLGAAYFAFAYLYPIILAFTGAVVVAGVASELGRGRRLARLAADRRAESICSFARAFDCRAVDTWVIRAVFEELQPYCRFGRRVLPLRATDDLEDDLGIDPEELDELASDIAIRVGRSLDDWDNNPFSGRIKAVGDLVSFLMAQPSRRAA